MLLLAALIFLLDYLGGLVMALIFSTKVATVEPLISSGVVGRWQVITVADPLPPLTPAN